MKRAKKMWDSRRRADERLEQKRKIFFMIVFMAALRGDWIHNAGSTDLVLDVWRFVRVYVMIWMAASFGLDAADEGLGYIWYYGRCGERDYKKAFYHYSRSMERGNLTCTYKVADMYKNGYFVEKDYEKYVSIIEGLYPRIKNARNLWDPLPEVYTRLARIRTEQGNAKEAVKLYAAAKDFLAQRLSYDPFFGNLNIMKWLIDDLYRLTPFDRMKFDFYDLYFLLKNPVKVRFSYFGEEQILEAVPEDGICAVHFNDRWYRDRDDFFGKACVDDERLTAVYDLLEGFEVV